jgi:DNA-binding transcriptional LysR family regulator
VNYQIDLRDLRYFETIAELGHLGRAAKQLHRTQPALTGCVRRLEAALGTPLFERVGRGIRLTGAGEALLARARQLRVAADETVREIQDVGRGAAGHIRIGVVPTGAYEFLPELCRSLLAETKDITLKTVIAQNDFLIASLHAGELDLLISSDPQNERDFVSRPVFEDEVVVTASAKHELLRKRPRLRDLLDYRWVLAAPSVETRQWLDQVFDRAGLARPTVQIETNLVLLLPPLIEQTGLLSFISRRHLGPGRVGSALKEVRLKETTMRRTFKLICRKDSYLPPAAQRFVSLLGTKDGIAVERQLVRTKP